MSFLKRNRIAIIWLFVAVVCLAIGVWREEFEIVLRKAINICLECIGLG